MPQKITSIDDLKKLRDQAKADIDLRSGPKEIQATVHMGTCGIAAGARDVLSAMSTEMMQAGVENVTLRRSGCIGLCDQEPMMTLRDKDGHEYQYVKLNPQKVHEIVQDHILGGQPVVAHLMHT
jgi:NADP-reducing hydrogenase subunit HndB